MFNAVQVVFIVVATLVLSSWACWEFERWCKDQVLPRRRDEDEGREDSGPG